MAPRLFSRATILRSIVIPAYVQVIGVRCFEYCTTLAILGFEPRSRLCCVDDSAFQKCIALQQCQFPASVRRLGQRCFSFCYSLQLVSFECGSELAEIGEAAFVGCQSLLEIRIPSTMGIHSWSCASGSESLVSFIRSVGDGWRGSAFPEKETIKILDDEYFEGYAQVFSDLAAHLAPFW
jgi:hypothetical protein